MFSTVKLELRHKFSLYLTLGCTSNCFPTHKEFNIRINQYCPKFWEFFPNCERDGKLGFQFLANRLYFQIFANSLKKWKIRILCSFIIFINLKRINFKFFSSHEGNSKSEFFVILQQQISIFFSTMLSGFFTISEEYISKFQKIKWHGGAKLTLSHKISSLNVSLSDSLMLLWEGPALHTGFMRGPVLIGDLRAPKTLGNLQPVLQMMGRCRNNSV